MSTREASRITPDTPTGAESLGWRSLLLNGGSLAVTRAISAVIAVARGLLTAKYLAPEAFGVFNLVNLLVSYGALSNLGLRPAAHREILYRHGKGDFSGKHAVQRTAITMTIALAGAFAAVTAGYGLFVASGTLRLALLTGAVLVVLTSLHGWLEATAWMSQRFSLIGRLQIIAAVVGLVLIVAGAALFGVTGALLAILVTQLVVFVAASRAVSLGYVVGLDRHVMRRLWRTAVPMFLSALALQGMRNVDYLIVIGRLSREDWGYYAFAVLAVSFLVNAALDFGRSMYPEMQQRYGARDDIGDIELHVADGLRLIAGLAAFIVGALMIGVHLPIELWLPAYGPSIPVIRVLLFAFFFHAVCLPGDLLLTTLNRQYLVLSFRAGLVAANVALAWLLVGRGWGIVGVALASTGAWAVYAVAVLAAAGTWLRHGRKLSLFLVGEAVLPVIYMGVGVLTVHYGGYRPTTLAGLAFMLVVYGLYFSPLFFRMGWRCGWTGQARRTV